MVIAGVFGIIVKYMHLNSAAIVLGLVLGGMCEQHFSLAFQGAHVITQPMTFSDIMAKIFGGLFGTPIAAVVMSLCILMLLSPIYMPLLKKAKK
jgi:putative tricarboxylic transport membrane protein